MTEYQQDLYRTAGYTLGLHRKPGKLNMRFLGNGISIQSEVGGITGIVCFHQSPRRSAEHWHWALKHEAIRKTKTTARTKKSNRPNQHGIRRGITDPMEELKHLIPFALVIVLFALQELRIECLENYAVNARTIESNEVRTSHPFHGTKLRTATADYRPVPIPTAKKVGRKKSLAVKTQSNLDQARRCNQDGPQTR